MGRTGGAGRPAFLAGLLGSGLALAPGAAMAQDQDLARELREMRAAIARQERQLQAQQRRLEEQSNRLSRQLQIVESQNEEIDRLRSGTGRATASQDRVLPRGRQAMAAAAVMPQGGEATDQPRLLRVQAQAQGQGAPATPGAAAPVSGDAARTAQRQDERRVVETDPTLARTGGVLTPRGMITFEPSFEYSYASNNLALLNGFTIIPGITFGELNIRRSQQHTLLSAATFRLGVTDRLEVNARIPYVYRSDSIGSQAIGTAATPQNADQRGNGLGDIEVGGSYQINSGRNDWPVFIANMRVKSTTGTSPFDVPTYTGTDFEGAFRGLPRRLPTGTGFWTVEPGITAVYPTDPAVLFGSIRYQWNVADRVAIRDGNTVTGRTRIDPGDGIAMNFGVGFALNEAASMSFGYEHVHVLSSRQANRTVRGSSYDLGTFNFGLSYRISNAIGFNLGVGIGVTENAPDTRIGFRIPIRYQLF